MNLEQALQTFFDESRDLLEDMEHILLDAEDEVRSVEQLNALFRTMHTIKGSAGIFGLNDIVHFTHQVENVLDQVRSGTLPLNEALVGLLLRCHDHVQALLAAAALNESAPLEAGVMLLQLLSSYFVPPESRTSTISPSAIVVDDSNDEQRWLLSLRFGMDILRNGMDPASFMRYLETLGVIECIRAITINIPPGKGFDPESNYLRFEAIYVGTASRQVLWDAFEFAREGSRILICPASQAPDVLLEAQQGLGPDEARALRQTWQEMGLLAPDAVGSDLLPPKMAEPAISVSEGPSRLSAEVKQARPTEAKFLKVEAHKLDNLINLIGELVIAGAAASVVAHRSDHAQMIEATVSIANLVEQIRATALSMRMIQIGEIFQRFPRVVHDVSRELNKNIELHILGADTELDKSMVDKLGDPLMHIVRNAIDHGIEAPQRRLEQGKSETGHVWLNAYHESGSVVIEVADDGAGLDPERILAKAVDSGLVAADAQLSELEIFKFIFEPGFSIAAQVTNISGRGVGMDVVRKSLDQLRGSIDIDSVLHEGTTFRIRLPLTLAIIDGFLVQVGDATFVIPLETVIECMELPVHLGVDDQLDHLNLRGEILPLLRLATFFELDAQPDKRQNVVVVRFGERKAGLVVDDLLGEFQTVIKPLGKLFHHLKAVSGSTILGTGEVALILDVNSLIQVAAQEESEQFSLHSVMTRQGFSAATHRSL